MKIRKNNLLKLLLGVVSLFLQSSLNSTHTQIPTQAPSFKKYADERIKNNLITFDELFKTYVLKRGSDELTEEEFNNIKKQAISLKACPWEMEREQIKNEDLNDNNWELFAKSPRSVIYSNSTDTKHIYKFCVNNTSRGNFAASFLRVPKGKEIKDILARKDLLARGLDKIGVVDESLICLSDINEAKTANEYNQCFHYVVKSKKENLCDEEETIYRIRSMEEYQQYEMCLQLIILIILSGLGDIGFHNFYMHKKKEQLILVDTEPYHGSLKLDIEEMQPNFNDLKNKFDEKAFSTQREYFKSDYMRYKLTRERLTNNWYGDSVKKGLEYLVESADKHNITVWSNLAKAALKELFPEIYTQLLFDAINSKIKVLPIKVTQNNNGYPSEHSSNSITFQELSCKQEERTQKNLKGQQQKNLNIKNNDTHNKDTNKSSSMPANNTKLNIIAVLSIGGVVVILLAFYFSSRVKSEEGSELEGDSINLQKIFYLA